LVLGGTGAETRDWIDVRDVVRLLAIIGKLSQQETCLVINGGSRRSISVGEVATILVKNWKHHVAVRYSGTVRAGDPFSFNQNRLAPCPGGDAIGLGFERPHAGLSVREFAGYFACC
jgi:nucleoside-diphosphate-sugar epimerase